MTDIAPDRAACQAYIRARLRAAAIAAAIVVPLVVTVLVLEYRVMILCALALLFPLVPLLQGLALRKQVGLGAIGVTFDAEGARVVVERGDSAEGTAYRDPQALREITAMRYAEIARAVVQPGALVLVKRTGVRAFQRFVIPDDPLHATVVKEHLARCGVEVTEDPGAGKLALAIGGVLGSKVLGVLAACMVAGAIAKIGLAALGHGGSYVTGGMLLLGALLALSVSAIVQRVLAAPK